MVYFGCFVIFFIEKITLKNNIDKKILLLILICADISIKTLKHKLHKYNTKNIYLTERKNCSLAKFVTIKKFNFKKKSLVDTKCQETTQHKNKSFQKLINNPTYVIRYSNVLARNKQSELILIQNCLFYVK